MNNIKRGYTDSLDLARQALVIRLLGGMAVREADARNLGLDWLAGQDAPVTMFCTAFDTAPAGDIDETVRQLIAKCAKICRHTVSICTDPGRIITLCVCRPEQRQQVEQAISGLFRQGGGKVRIESAVSDGSSGLAGMYASLTQRPPQGRADVSRSLKSKRQIADEVEKIISQQYMQPLTLESIARSLHFTPNYIGAVFKAVTRTSVSRRLMTVRLEKVKEMLLGTSLPVNDIAVECGFGSITYFHTIFKKEFGLTPSEYRQAGR